MTPAEAANLPRFDGRQAPFYEVWFVEVQDAAHDTGLWLRYTLSSPAGGPAVAELWAMYFDRRDPSRSFGQKRTIPLAEAQLSRERFRFQIGGAELFHYGCRGEIGEDSRRIRWDLSWSEDRLLLHYPTDLMYRAALPRTKVTSPHFDLRASGSYEVGGERFELHESPGQQSHLWGTEHAQRWRWCHANTFVEDSTAVFEALTAEVKVGPFSAPPLTMFALCLQGSLHTFNGPLDLLQKNESRTDSKLEPDGHYPVSRWMVGGGDSRLRFRGEIWAELPLYLGVRYHDPDGSTRVCNHSKLASVCLEILEPDGSGGWRVSSRLTTRAGAVEFVGKEPDPRVPLGVP